MNRKKISITASCYNEEGNIEELYRRCRNVLAKHPIRISIFWKTTVPPTAPAKFSAASRQKTSTSK